MRVKVYKVVLVLVWLKEVKEMVVRGDGLPPGPGNGGCNRGDGLPPVPGTPSQQGSITRIWDGWTNT